MQSSANASLLRSKPKRPGRMVAIVVACSTALAGLGGAVFALRTGELAPPPRRPFNQTAFANGSWVEVHRVSPVCLSAGASYREGLGFGWPYEGEPPPAEPIRYGVWFVIVPGQTGLFVELRRPIVFDTRERALREWGPDTWWCSMAHARGHLSIVIGSSFGGVTELVACDDENNVPSIGPCPPDRRVYDADGDLCPCSDIMNSLNCGYDPHPETCEDAMERFHRMTGSPCC